MALLPSLQNRYVLAGKSEINAMLYYTTNDMWT